MARDGWAVIVLKGIVYLAVFGVIYYCVCLSGVKSEHQLMREQVQLLKEQVRVLHQLEARTEQLCEVKLGMGRVCRSALRELVQRLGLDKQPKSAARTVLEAFDGLGGPDE